MGLASSSWTPAVGLAATFVTGAVVAAGRDSAEAGPCMGWWQQFVGAILQATVTANPTAAAALAAGLPRPGSGQLADALVAVLQEVSAAPS